MKPHLLILLILFSLGSVAQKIAPKDTLKPKTQLSSSEIANLLPKITPKSPNVAALEKFGQYPVSLYTGLPTIEIPIFEIKVGNLTIPIKLTYHAGGNKVSDNASWVGMGWSMTGLYSISRTIRGRADEDSNNGGLLGQNLPSYPQFLTCLTEQLKSDLSLYVDYNKDIERDVFNYRSPRKSNSFVITPSQIVFQEAEKSTISYATNLSSFTLNDESGYQYVYDVGESTFANNTTSTTAWHLSSIQGNKPVDRVEFLYQNAANVNFTAEINDTEVWNTEVCGANYNTIPTGLQSNTYSTVGAGVFMRLLKEIVFPYGKIVFVQSSNDREDGLGKSLSAVEIYGINSNTGGYELLKKYALDYIYKNRINPTNANDKVLFLDKVRMLGNDNSLIGQYSLSYNAQALPYTESRSKDYWGYYNGQNNSTLIPSQTVPVNLTCFSSQSNINVGGANRSPNETLMKAWMIERIDLPTGGYSIFDFEANRYLDYINGQYQSVITGGLRIKSIVSYDNNGKNITKTYKYGYNKDGNGTNRDLTPQNYYTLQYNKHPMLYANGDVEYNYNVRVFSSGFSNPTLPNEGVTTTYGYVTEYEDNGAGSNGRTEYSFREDGGDNLVSINSTAKQIPISRHWNRGQLKSKAVFGADNKFKYGIHNQYTVTTSSQSPVLGYLIGRAEIRLNPTTPDANGCLVNDDNYNPIQSYQWSTGLVQLTTTNEEYNDDIGDNSYTSKITETDYDPITFQAKQTRQIVSDGSTKISKFRYVTDFDTQNNTASPLYALSQNNQIDLAIETISLVKLPNESQNRVLSAQITDFTAPITLNGRSYVYPKDIFLFENPNYPTPIFESSFQLATLSGASTNKDSKYIKRIELLSYDTYGNLLSFKQPASATTVLGYNTLNTGNVYHSFVVTETKDAYGSSPHTTIFGYDFPLLGIKESIAPNGLKTSFEYDNFMRFKRARDHDGNILKEHVYNYASVSGYNFIKELVPRVAMAALSGGYNQYQTNINYFDGLSRSMQTVQLSAGPNGSNDIIIGATTYDNFDRADKSYVPFANTGNGDLAALPSSIDNDNVPYSNVLEYDNSPLNRPRKTFGVGQAWRTANKYKETKLRVYSSFIFTRYSLTSTGAYFDQYPFYTRLQHYYNYDEQGNQILEIKDEYGKILNKMVSSPSVNQSFAMNYIYDEFDRIKYVIQPNAYGTTSFTESDAIFSEGIFGYHYDNRGRVIESHVPGNGWTYNVYDLLDRLVMSQTALQRLNNKWLFLKYDALGRVVVKGELTNTNTRQSLQNDFDDMNVAYEVWNGSYTNQSYPSSVGYTQSDIKEIVHFDHYNWAVPAGFDLSNAFHSQYTNAKGLATGSQTKDINNSNWMSSALYYDSKNRPIQTFKTNLYGQTERTDLQYNFAGDVLKARETHIPPSGGGGLTLITENDFDHVGRKTALYMTINNGTRDKIATYNYDNVGRLVQKKIMPDRVYQQYGSTPEFINRNTNPSANTNDIATKAVCILPNTTILPGVGNSYLAQIGAGVSLGTVQGLQTIDFGYHIRGWLKSINSGNLNDTENDFFAHQLEFETDGTYFDGNIRKESWKSKLNTGNNRNYVYDYDFANRLTTAVYSGGMYAGEDFSFAVNGYDGNGNILGITRKGATALNNGTPTSFGTIDLMNYSYNGNRLTGISDAINGNIDVGDFRDGNTSGNDYEYWPDGSLKKDLNRRISQIDWDSYLKKPTLITYTDGRWINHYYDGTGTKLKSLDSDNVLWEYANGAIYKNGQPYQIGIPEGRLVYNPTSGGWGTEFDYKDHLGNLRLSFKEGDGSPSNGVYPAPIISQENSYFPFGLAHKGIDYNQSTPNNFQYNGKEKISSFELNWSDYGFRSLDLLSCRFISSDPLAEKFTELSNYQYSGNMPIKFVDLDGLEPAYYEPNSTRKVPIPTMASDQNQHKMPANATLVHNPNQEKTDTKTDKLVNGVTNATMGAVGMAGSAFAIVESGGIVAATGGTAAFSLAFGETTIGITQIVDALGNKNSDDTKILHEVSSAPALVGAASGMDKGSVAKLDALSQLLPGLLTGGNLVGITQVPFAIKKAGTTGEKVYHLTSGVDGVMDYTGAVNAFTQSLDKKEQKK